MTCVLAEDILQPLATLIAAVVTGVVVLVGIRWTQRLTHENGLKRERSAELRTALAEFGAASYTVLSFRDRGLIHDRLFERYATEAESGQTSIEVAKKTDEMAYENEKRYSDCLDAFAEARCRLMVLEADGNARLAAQIVALAVASNRSNHMNPVVVSEQDEIPKVRAVLDAWIVAQSKRTDI